MTAQGNRDGAIARALDYFDSGAFLEELARRVGYRTESQKPDSQAHLHAYLDEDIIPAFEGMGFTWTKFDNPLAGGGPFLLAERVEDAALPTILGYGHGDVILGLEDQWTKGKGAWEIAEDGDRVYGRGTADNKGQHTINMAATRCVLAERGNLGFNAKFLIEMGEENGSRGLREVIEANLDAFSADVFIGSDGPRISPGQPTLTLGARGGENFELTVNLREGGHHSGNWGGLIADPATILAHAIASIVGPTGQIKIPEWLPPPTPASVKEALKGLVIEPGPGAPEIDPDWGEPGLTPAEKVYSWNSFAVLAMKSGHPESPVNAISPWAKAHCQLRYFAGTDAENIVPALRRHLDANGFQMVEIGRPPPENTAGFAASRTEPDHPWVATVRQSMQNTIGAPPAVIPSMGGSICNDLFTDLLGLPAIWIPHSYAACSQHAPDEHILKSVTRTALPIMAGIYWDIGAGNYPKAD